MKTKNSEYVKIQKGKSKKKKTEVERRLTLDEQIDQFVTILVNTYFKLENEKINGKEG